MPIGRGRTTSTQRSGDAARLLSDRLAQVWNDDDTVVAQAITPRNFAVPWRNSVRGVAAHSQLVACYKSIAPDLQVGVSVTRPGTQEATFRWQAVGTHAGHAAGLRPTHRRIALNDEVRVRLNGAAVSAMHSGWGLDQLLAAIGCAPKQRDSLLTSNRRPQIRAIGSGGVPLLLFPVMNLPGWLTWGAHLGACAGERLVITFEMLATRWALEEHRRADYSLSAEVEALADMLKEQHLSGPFDVVGNSSGGAMALAFALHSQHALRTLTLIEPTAVWVLGPRTTVEAPLRHYYTAQIETFHRTPSADAIADLFTRGGFFSSRADAVHSPQWPLYLAYKNHLWYRASIYEYAADLARLETLTVPTLVIRGTTSHPFYHAIADTLVQRMAHAALYTLQGGHVPHRGSNTDGFIRYLQRLGSTPLIAEGEEMRALAEACVGSRPHERHG